VDARAAAERVREEKKMKPKVKEKISTLWIVVMFNMVFADVLTMQIPEFARELVDGTTDVKITEGMMLASAVFIVIPIAMIFFSRVLGDTANRRANTAASIITAVFIVGGAEFVAHYYFFAVVELVCLSLIVRYVWHRAARDAGATATGVHVASTPGGKA
jgi:hypothetical protein